jgi:hypothetical protein
MRWKLFRRRLSISAPRMIVRSHLPWPLRWAALALMFGFSAAIALWAFEFGRDIAGLDRNAKAELLQLRAEVVQLRAERDKAQAIANTAESLLKAERTAQEKLAGQLRQVETDNVALKADLGFFERLFPAGARDTPAVRGLQIEAKAPGQLRYQLLVMQAGKKVNEFVGRYDLVMTGTLDGLPWTQSMNGGPQTLQLKQYARIEGLLVYPEQAVVKAVQVKVLDSAGTVRATQTTRL